VAIINLADDLWIPVIGEQTKLFFKVHFLHCLVLPVTKEGLQYRMIPVVETILRLAMTIQVPSDYAQ
jgi:hypothetical protein